MKKDTKAMVIMVSGIFIVGIGSELITPFSLISGTVVGLVGCGMFIFGSLFILNSMLKSIPEIISLTKKAVNKRK